MESVEIGLALLYRKWSGTEPDSIRKLPGSGSGRIYYRIQGTAGSIIGVYNDDIRENQAFIHFSKQFLEKNLPVPAVLEIGSDQRLYLISDLGDSTLYRLLTELRSPEDPFPDQIMDLYREAIGWLPVFQIDAGKRLDYTCCYPRPAFDRQSMMWDLNYFKYYFLRLARIPFDEQALEDDFNTLCDRLLIHDSGYFLYRDFQSRNIMVHNGTTWFIDYQGGRKGALQYDIASILMDAKADIPEKNREQLLAFYLDRLEEFQPVNRELFIAGYYDFVLIRILQALGAYGFRGYYENKAHFLLSIPYALRNLAYLRETGRIANGLPVLAKVIDGMIARKELYHEQKINSDLTVSIFSFSYKKGLSGDPGGNGGGFVFDCRALPNPGRMDEFRELTGLDQPVGAFLGKDPAVNAFLSNVYALVDLSVKDYINRGFSHLMVSFGCTGGQHRSVYCAEQLAHYLRERFRIQIVINHLEHEHWSGR